MYTASITILILIFYGYTYQASSMEYTLIRAGPFNVTNKEGNSAKLTCTLNYPPTKRMWMKNATAINIDDKRYTEKYNVQTRKFTLEIDPVKRSDKGYYQCYIERNAKKQTSQKAWLRVMTETTGKPYPICKISKPIYNLCETVHMTCMTEIKSPPDTLVFFANVTTALTMKSMMYPFYRLDSTPEYSSKPIKTLYQCSNETNRWITSEFKADKTLNNSRITCRMSPNDYSDSRQCNETLRILPEEFNHRPIECKTSKRLYESGEDVEFTCTVDKLTPDTSIELHGKSHTTVYRSNATHAWITSKFKANKKDDGLTVSCKMSNIFSQPVTCSMVLNISTTANRPTVANSTPVCDCNHEGMIWGIIILSFVIFVSLFFPPWFFLYVKSEIIRPGRRPTDLFTYLRIMWGCQGSGQTDADSDTDELASGPLTGT